MYAGAVRAAILVQVTNKRRLHGPGAQDVDGPSHVERLSEPEGARRPPVQLKAPRVVTRPQSLDGIRGHRGGRRHLGQRPTIRPLEPQRPVRSPRDLVTLLVHRPMMPPTEQRKVRQRGRAALGPVAQMVIPMVEGTA